jgi:general secretion pathway protein K
MLLYKKGFILVTTLWVLAMLTMAASFFALWTQRTIETAQRLQDDLQAKIEMHNTQANIIYLLTTQRFTVAGLTVSEGSSGQDNSPTTLEELNDPNKSLDEIMDEFMEMQKRLKAQKQKPQFDIFEGKSTLSVGKEIALDDRPHFGDGNAYFALQDIGGLLNIQVSQDWAINRLFELLGVQSKLHAPLIAKLQDYTDLDDLHRINGAESYHYEERQLPPPRNRFLITSMESYHILDWAEQSSLWKNNQFGQLTQTFLALRPNFNTAPSLVLQAAYNLNADAAEQIIKMRQGVPFLNLHTVTQIAGMPPQVEPEYTNFLAKPILRLTLWHDRTQRMQQVYIRLTDKDDGGKPWRIEYRTELNLLPRYTEIPPIHVQTSLFKPTLPTETQ